MTGLIPVGASPDSVTVAKPLTVPSTSTVTATLTLAEPLVPMQLVLYVWDLNGNRGRSVVRSVVGAVSATDLPRAPTTLRATSGLSNTLSVSWQPALTSPAATEWVLTAVSGPERRTATVPGATLSHAFADLPGRRDWIVSVAGRGTYGTGPASSSSGVTVADTFPRHRRRVWSSRPRTTPSSCRGRIPRPSTSATSW